MTSQLLKQKIDFRLFLLFALIIVCLFCFPAAAQSAAPVDPTSLFRKVLNLLTGDMATIIAAIAVVILGIGALFGFWDFRKAGYIVLGIVLIFGAAWIVQTLTGKTVTI